MDFGHIFSHRKEENMSSETGQTQLRDTREQKDYDSRDWDSPDVGPTRSGFPRHLYCMYVCMYVCIEGEEASLAPPVLVQSGMRPALNATASPHFSALTDSLTTLNTKQRETN